MGIQPISLCIHPSMHPLIIHSANECKILETWCVMSLTRIMVFTLSSKARRMHGLSASAQAFWITEHSGLSRDQTVWINMEYYRYIATV